MFNHSRNLETIHLLNNDIEVSDIRANNNDQQSERRSFRISTSSDESIDRHMSGYENRGMNTSDETDGLVNNYGTINGSNATIGSSGGGSAATLGVDTDGNGPSGRHHIDISRDVIDFDDLNRKYGKQIHPKESFGRQLCRSAKNYGKTCSPFSVLLSLFPIVNWIKSYSIKEYLISDVIAGFTILILHIPQGMAYGMLAGLSAINGLYVSFFPVLIYSLMGTSRHLSIGTFAIISIMSSNAAHKLNAIPTDPTLHHSNSTSGAEDYTTLEVLTSLCMLTGIFQFLMGFIQLGSLSVILSDTLVSAFSTGCAIQVATSQLNSLFDIKVKDKEPIKGLPFKMVNDWIGIAKELPHTNLVTLGLSAFGIGLLIVVKEFIEPKIKKRFKTNIPFPIDIMLVIGFTIFSWLMNLHKNHNVGIMLDIPKGLPEPRLPRFDLLSKIIIDALVIAIVAFAVSLSLAKIFAKKHKYRIDANQELIALGSANVFASLFSCYPSSASLSRSSVQEKTGGRTQVAGLVSSAFMLVFLLFLGPLLYHLPKATLSCIILVALKSMFLQFGDLINSWKISKLQAMQWLITFLGVILLGVDIGLIVGVIFSIICVLLRFTIPKSTINGQLPFSEIYVDSQEFSEAKQIPGIKIFQFHCPLFFMNSHNFKTNLYKKTLNISSEDIERLHEEKPVIHTIVLDFSSVFFVDSTGVETMVECIDELDDLRIQVIICQCSQSVIQMMDKMGFFAKLANPRICATVHDAVVLNERTNCA